MISVYKISQHIPAGDVDAGDLKAEVEASGFVTGPVSVSRAGDEVSISCDSVINQTGLNNLVAAHEPVPLAEHKKNKNAAIDEKTRAIIAQGFSFAGLQFSLSPAAQMNWSGLKTFDALLTWPVKVTTLDDGEYELAQANRDAFVGSGIQVVSDAYTSGRALKLQVNAAADKAAVDAVVDSR